MPDSKTMPRVPSTPAPAPAAMPQGSISRNARTVALATLASRVLGLLRDVGMASVFGLGPTADAFYVAFTIPNSFRRLFGEGALSAAFIPSFIEARDRRGAPAARALFARTCGSLLVLLALLSGLVCLGCLALSWLDIFPQHSFTFELASILAAYTLPICLVALAMGALNAAGHFLMPALSPVILNLIWIAVLYLLLPLLSSDAVQARALAVAIVVAGGVQLLAQLPGLRSRGLLVRPRLAFNHPDIARIRRRMAPIVFGLAVFQVNDLIDKGVAWLLVDDAGAVTALYYGNRLLQFPLALVGIAVGTAAFPVFARLWTAQRRTELRAQLDRSLGLVLFFALPASIGMAAVAPELVSVLFERGEFGADAVYRTVAVTGVYCSAVWALAMQAVLVRFFQAVERRDIPVRAGLVAVCFNLVLDFTLVWSLRECGLALATAVASLVQTGLLYAWVRRPLGQDSEALRAAPRALIAACACGLAALAVASWLPAGPWALLASVCSGMLVFAGSAWLLFRREGLRRLLHGRSAAEGR